MTHRTAGFFVLLFGALLILSGCSETRRPLQLDAHRSPALLLNLDCTNFFYNKSPELMTSEKLDAYADSIMASGATVVLINTQAERANYASEAFEPFWQGYDPAADDDQPFFAAIPPQGRAAYRRLVDCMLALHERGIDYPGRLIERCRQKSVSPWISLRMNDTHNNDNLYHPIHSTFWRENPDCWRINDRRVDYYDRTLDYSCPGVRHRYLALIDETLERYDIDGLELDFLREPYLFPIGREAENRDLLTAWIDTVRQRVTAAERKRGHTIYLGVRVPADPETARQLGLDAVTWAQQGSVDLIVASPRWATIDNEVPVHTWKSLLRGTDVALACGLEVRYQPYENGPAAMASPDVASGAALAALDAGADAIYLFNYFFMHFPGTDWSFQAFSERLQAMAEQQKLEQLSRRHGVTWSDVYAHGTPIARPLPSHAARHFYRLST
ncbi:hypothetical protein JW992_05505, partial [candidate division KSB1 bacterium]|nr:hypothetical protein [candidate division KSB1 bacterium]